MIVSVILTLIVTIVAVMFSLQNTTMVTVSFFGYPVEGAIGLFMLIALGVGVLLGILLMVPSVIGRSLALRRHKRRIAELEGQPVQKPQEDDSKKLAI